jgi:hypothetical protein
MNSIKKRSTRTRFLNNHEPRRFLEDDDDDDFIPPPPVAPTPGNSRLPLAWRNIRLFLFLADDDDVAFETFFL